MTSDTLKRTIFEAFKDVLKGESLGVRECAALDDYATEEGVAEARIEDVEQHWWEYPDSLKEYSFDKTLAYSNRDGVRFHLPALMTAIIDGLSSADVSVYMTLCIRKTSEMAPHHGHKAYVDYLKSFDVQQIISYYGFTDEQIHAIALYLSWETGTDHLDFIANRKEMLRIRKITHDNTVGVVPELHYNLTLDDVIAIQDEEHRIVFDWLRAGNVSIPTSIFPDSTDR